MISSSFSQSSSATQGLTVRLKQGIIGRNECATVEL
jgi:uncharacterized protein YwbE